MIPSPEEVLAVLYFFVPAYLANMAPVLIRDHWQVLAVPIDGGACLRGRRLLGDHKTWRGIVSGIAAGILAYEVQRIAYLAGSFQGITDFDYGAYRVLPGLLLGIGAGAGDAIKSLFKRQAGIAPGHAWFPFDQLDFLVGAYCCVSLIHAPSPAATIAAAPIILAGGIASSAVGYRLGWKEARI